MTVLGRVRKFRQRRQTRQCYSGPGASKGLYIKHSCPPNLFRWAEHELYFDLLFLGCLPCVCFSPTREFRYALFFLLNSTEFCRLLKKTWNRLLKNKNEIFSVTFFIIVLVITLIVAAIWSGRDIKTTSKMYGHYLKDTHFAVVARNRFTKATGLVPIKADYRPKKYQRTLWVNSVRITLG